MPLDPLVFENAKKSESDQPSQQPTYTGPGVKLINITQNLTDLIKRETSLMLARRAQDAGRLHGEKSRLMAEYKNVLGHIKVNEHLLGSKDSPIRSKIREVTDKFREELRNHARVVMRLKSVAEGMVKSVGEEIAKRDRPVVGYGSNASLRAPNPMRPTSLSINQMI